MECGWGADGAHRSLGMEDEADAVKQIRLMTRIADEGSSTGDG